jgi:hypothetical protein
LWQVMPLLAWLGVSLGQVSTFSRCRVTLAGLVPEA